MKKFFLRFFLFIAPYLLFFALPAVVLFRGREVGSHDEIIRMQAENKQPVLYGPAYSNPVAYYKFQSIQARNAEIVALGSSRIMELRGAYFNSPNFWNAGVGRLKLEDIYDFVNALPDTTSVKLLFLNLDQYWFNASNSQKRYYNPSSFKKIRNNISLLSEKSLEIYKDLFSGNIRYADLLSDRDSIYRVGLSSFMDNNGFRNDGSYKYGKLCRLALQDTAAFNAHKNSYLNFIRSGQAYFAPGNEISSKAINRLEALLRLCKEKGIYTVAFLSPLSGEANEIIKKKWDTHSYLYKLEARIGTVCKANEISFFNFTDPRPLSATDEEFIDPLHPSEKLILRMVIRMAEVDQKVRQYVKLAELKNMLEAAPNPLQVLAD